MNFFFPLLMLAAAAGLFWLATRFHADAGWFIAGGCIALALAFTGSGEGSSSKK